MPDDRRSGLARLWAPWRMEYIQSAVEAPARRGGKRAAASRRPDAAGAEECLFCRVASRREDRKDLVIARRPRALLMLNRYPYSPGHLMVAVAAHKARFADLDAAESTDLIEMVSVAEQALAAEYRPHGTNYGMNLGRVAGAGFPGHLHLHLVPRWDGDTNFMPVIGETRVLPESLDRTWQRLRRALRALKGARRGARR